MAILISEKIGFKSQIITSAKEGHFTMIKDSVLLEDTPHTNMYGANKRATNTQNRRGKIQQFRDFNVPLSIINRKIREKINKETETLNSTINQRDLTDTTEYSTQQQQSTHYSQVHM